MIKIDNDHEAHLSSRMDVSREEVRRLIPDAYSVGRSLVQEYRGDKAAELRVWSLWRSLQIALRIATGGMGNASRWYKT